MNFFKNLFVKQQPEQNNNQQNNQNQPKDEKKTMKIYYKEQLQQIGYYPGTQTQDLLQTVRGLFSINQDDMMIFQDENGIPVVISCHVPDGISFNLIVKEQKLNKQEEFKVEDAEKQMKENLKKDDPGQEKTGVLKFVLKDSNRYQLKLSQNNKRATGWNMETAFEQLQVDLLLEKGKKYYFEYEFEKLTCCMTSCLYCSQDSERQGEQSNISMNFGCTGTNSEALNVTVGIAVNMQSKKWYIIDPSKKKAVQQYQINSSWENPKLTLWTKHNEAVAKIGDLKAYPNFI